MPATRKRSRPSVPRTASRSSGLRKGPEGSAARGDTERRILEAARRVFARRGSAGARMQEIAAEAGVNQALLHYYFRSKKALAHAVFREAAGRLFPGLLRLLAGDAPLEERIEAVVHHYIDTLQDHPYLPGYVLAEIHFDPARIPALAAEMHGPDQAARRAVLAKLDKDLAARAKAGTFRPMKVEQFLVNLASLCVFPFAARPMLGHVLGIEPAAWDAFFAARRAELPRVILSAMRP